MTPEQMQSILDKAMFYSREAVWAPMADPGVEEYGYKAYAGTVTDDERLLHRYLVLAQPKDSTTARGTYIGIAENLIMNLPPENAWTLFEEATRSLKTT